MNSISMKFVLCLVLIFTISRSVFANSVESFPPKVQQLLKLKHRPTMAEFLDAFDGKLPAKNIFGSASQSAGVAVSEGAKIIAILEKAYPGAIYTSMGRDAVNMTDFLEAFYLYHGQEGRAGRIEVSGSSFPLNEATFVKYLEQKGLNLDPQAEVDRGFVIFDRTSFGAGSQSTKIKNLIEGYFAKRGGSAAELHKRFAMATTHNLQPLTAEGITNRVKAGLAVGLNSGFTDLMPWHDSYSPLVLNPTTKEVEASPGALFDIPTRLKVLSDLYVFAKTVTLPEFQANLRKYEAHFDVVVLASANNLTLSKWLKTASLSDIKNEFAEVIKLGNSAEIANWMRELSKNFTTGSNAHAVYTMVSENLEGMLAKKDLRIGQSLMKYYGYDKEKTKYVAISLINSGVLKDFYSMQFLTSNLQAEVVDQVSGLIFEREALLSKMTSHLYKQELKLAELEVVLEPFVKYVKTPKDFEKLVSYNRTEADVHFKHVMDAYIVKNFNSFVGLGATVEDVKSLEKRVISRRKNKIETWNSTLPLVKSADDFVSLVTYPKVSISEKYKAEMDNFVNNNWNNFLALNPSDDQIKAVLRNSVNNAKLFEKILDSRVRNNYAVADAIAFLDPDLAAGDALKMAVLEAQAQKAVNGLADQIRHESEFKDVKKTIGTLISGEQMQWLEISVDGNAEKTLKFIEQNVKTNFYTHNEEIILKKLLTQQPSWEQVDKALELSSYRLLNVSQDLWNSYLNSTKSSAQLDRLVLSFQHAGPRMPSQMQLEILKNIFANTDMTFTQSMGLLKGSTVNILITEPDFYQADILKKTATKTEIIEMALLINSRLTPKTRAASPLLESYANKFMALNPIDSEIQYFLKIFDRNPKIYEGVYTTIFSYKKSQGVEKPVIKAGSSSIITNAKLKVWSWFERTSADGGNRTVPSSGSVNSCRLYYGN